MAVAFCVLFCVCFCCSCFFLLMCVCVCVFGGGGGDRNLTKDKRILDNREQRKYLLS